jgi:geranylgeranyl pyrophosphate synthase
LEPIRPDLERVVHLLCETAAKIDEPLGTKLRSLVGVGKCMRPALVLLVGKLFSAPLERFYTLAASVEMLHTATLIHDDLVDGASLRRGRETLHTTLPVHTAVLAGDVLLAQAISLVADLGCPRILRVFAEALCVMSAGEATQILAPAAKQGSREAYYRRVGAKTSSFCGAAMEMASILAGASESQVAILRRFGWELGIAFQIADDALDFVGDEAQLGKPAGNDLRQGIVTLPVICYLEQAADDTFVSAVLAGQRDAEHVRTAVEVIRASGSIEAALAEARAHAEGAQQTLTSLPENGARRTLHALAEYAVRRER